MADYFTAQREQMADNSTSLPDGGFPIANRRDLANAILARARALGAVSLLPASWNVTS